VSVTVDKGRVMNQTMRTHSTRGFTVVEVLFFSNPSQITCGTFGVGWRGEKTLSDFGSSRGYPLYIKEWVRS
jgi:hypothetical protein